MLIAAGIAVLFVSFLALGIVLGFRHARAIQSFPEHQSVWPVMIHQDEPPLPCRGEDEI